MASATSWPTAKARHPTSEPKAAEWAQVPGPLRSRALAAQLRTGPTHDVTATFGGLGPTGSIGALAWIAVTLPITGVVNALAFVGALTHLSISVSTVCSP
jgi:hypothetical protein